MAHKRFKHWNDEAAKLLVGRKIVAASYLTDEELAEMEWSRSGLVLALDDGTAIVVAQDDEANGPGSLHIDAQGKHHILPTL